MNTRSVWAIFSPLRAPAFAMLWVAAVLDDTGGFMRDTASTWLITDLSASPAAVSAIQAAGTLPAFLLAIPAGVMTDILDRRRTLIAIQIALGAVSAALLLLARAGVMRIEYLIALTFIGGVGSALAGPGWQAIVADVVPSGELKNAVELNSLGVNIARSIGPIVGGVLLVTLGAVSAYGAHVALNMLVIAAFLLWRSNEKRDDALSEGFFGAFRAGIRYALASKELHTVLFRAVAFFSCASSIWALLPLVARDLLGGNAGTYGVLLGAIGIGGVLGALMLSFVHRMLNIKSIMLIATSATAIAIEGIALEPPHWMAMISLVLLGAGWLTALTSLGGIAQTILPSWVRGRALAVYLMAFNGAMAAGSILWGLVASEAGVQNALQLSAVVLLIGALFGIRNALPSGDLDLTPSNHWPQPDHNHVVEKERGPILVIVEYRIHGTERPAFLKCLHELSFVRRRDGAYAWGITEDLADPERVIEWFMVESWAEHMRQHRRVSHAAADLQLEAARYHIGPGEPEVRHLLALNGRIKSS